MLLSLLFQRDFNQPPLRCLASDEVQELSKKFMHDYVRSTKGAIICLNN